MTIYQRIRDLREDADKTQEEMAKIFDMGTTQYQRYENGLTRVPLDFAKRLAIYYNVSIDYIAGLTNTKKSYKDEKPNNNIIITQQSGNSAAINLK